jgi:hypothetical protein
LVCCTEKNLATLQQQRQNWRKEKIPFNSFTGNEKLFCFSRTTIMNFWANIDEWYSVISCYYNSRSTIHVHTHNYFVFVSPTYVCTKYRHVCTYPRKFASKIVFCIQPPKCCT